jgi:hypothetical protein
MCLLCAALHPEDPTARFATHADGSGPSGVVAAASASQLNNLSNYLRVGFWQDQGDGARSFNISVGDTLTYDVTGLSKAEPVSYTHVRAHETM